MSDDISSQLAALRIDRSGAPPTPTGSGGGSGGGWIKWVVGLALLGAVGGGAAYTWPRVQASMNTPEVEVATIYTVAPSDSLVAVTATGYVVPLRTAQLGAEVVARITAVHVTEGQAVTGGTVLFELDSSDLQQQLATAERRVAAARARAAAVTTETQVTETQLIRERALLERGAGLKATVDDLQARLAAQNSQARASQADAAVAAAELEQLRKTLDNFQVVAPFDGVVVNKPQEAGSVPDPTRPLVDLMDSASLVVAADVPESRMASLQLGTPAEVIFDAWPDKPFRGTIESFAPRIDRAKATATARVRIKEAPPLMSDMAARVRFLREELPEGSAQAPKTVIPSAALVDDAGQKVVYVIEGDAVRRTVVTVGAAQGDGFELLTGPAVGTRLVKRPAATLTDGTRIKEKKL